MIFQNWQRQGTIVTRNSRKFSRVVVGLPIVDWYQTAKE